MRKLAALALTAALVVIAAPASATELQVANWLPAGHPLVARVIRPWTQEITQATNGRVTFRWIEAPLGPPAAHFDFAVNGIADVTFGVHNYTPGRFVATLLAELPFQTEKAEYLSVAYWRIQQRYLDRAAMLAGTAIPTGSRPARSPPAARSAFSFRRRSSWSCTA